VWASLTQKETIFERVGGGVLEPWKDESSLPPQNTSGALELCLGLVSTANALVKQRQRQHRQQWEKKPGQAEEEVRAVR